MKTHQTEPNNEADMLAMIGAAMAPPTWSPATLAKLEQEVWRRTERAPRGLVSLAALIPTAAAIAMLLWMPAMPLATAAGAVDWWTPLVLASTDVSPNAADDEATTDEVVLPLATPTPDTDLEALLPNDMQALALWLDSGRVQQANATTTAKPKRF